MAHLSSTTTSITEDEMSISVPSSGVLGTAPRKTFVTLIESFAVDVLEEASKEEFAHRAESSQLVQYTTRHFVQAASVVRSRGSSSRRKPRWYIGVEIAQPLLFLIAGASFGLLPSGWGWVVPAITCTFLAAGGLSSCKTQ